MIEALAPLRVRFTEGEIRLSPGQPVDFPEDRARKLLVKAASKVRLVEEGTSSGPPLEEGRRLYEARGWLVIDSRTLGRRVLLARDEEVARTGEREAQRLFQEIPPVVFASEIPRLKALGPEELRQVFNLTPAERESVLEARQVFDGTILDRSK